MKISALSFLLLAPVGVSAIPEIPLDTASCGDAQSVATVVDGKAVAMCYFPAAQIAFKDAKTKCQGLGMQLVMPKTEKKAKMVKTVCMDVDAPYGHDCTWIDLECHGTNFECDEGFGNWKYGDGTPLVGAHNEMKMDVGTATIVGGSLSDELCAHFWGTNEAAEWGPQTCSDHWYGALCEPTGGGEGPTTYGDPHFKTWSGEKYDFHGACDLVLVENKGFSNGMGMNINIRTKERTWWSYIESAVVQLGDSTLEVKAGLKSSSYWINGGEETELVTGEASIGDFPVHFKRINDHHTSARIDLGNGDAIGIETFKDFVRVNIKNKSDKAFTGSKGLLGAYPDGAKIGRDGKTVFEDANEFGMEWQVLASEPSLFHTLEGAVLPPNKCAMPDATKKSQKRRLGESLISEEDAAVACARVPEADRDACIFDVMATNDKDMAGSY